MLHLTLPPSSERRLAPRLTSRPTIILTSSRIEVSALFTLPMRRPSRSTVTRSAICMTSPSLWVMSTMLLPSSRRRREGDEQLVHLLGGEHGGGLVENQHLGVFVQHFQDLDPLALAHRQVADPRPHIQAKAVFPRQLFHGLGGTVKVEEQPLARLQPRDDVFGDREHRAPA